MDELARHIRTEWDMMRNHRNSAMAGTSGCCMRSASSTASTTTQLMDIKQFGGSEVYARVIALKCRGASALLREVYLSTERPWGLDPTPEPTLPDDIMGSACSSSPWRRRLGIMADGSRPTSTPCATALTS
jgi:hypothetical protein